MKFKFLVFSLLVVMVTALSCGYDSYTYYFVDHSHDVDCTCDSPYEGVDTTLDDYVEVDGGSDGGPTQTTDAGTPDSGTDPAPADAGYHKPKCKKHHKRK